MNVKVEVAPLIIGLVTKDFARVGAGDGMRHPLKVTLSIANLELLFWDPVAEFFIRYIYKLGFLDGLRGFILSFLMAIYKISIQVKLYELQYLNK